MIANPLVHELVVAGGVGMRRLDALGSRSRRQSSAGEASASGSRRRRRERSSDFVLAHARHGGVGERMRAFFSLCVCYAYQSTLDWVSERLGHPRGRRVRPSRWSWFSIMGSVIVQEIDDTCAISACTMCIEAQHRLAFERLHGAGSFTFQAKNPTWLTRRCQKSSVWAPDEGAAIEDVLDVIKNSTGVLTMKIPNDIFLPVIGYEEFNTPTSRKLSPVRFAKMSHKRGPMISVLDVDKHYYIDDIYRGSREAEKHGHAVVCFGYCFVAEGLLVHIMDNTEPDGPVKWIPYSVFRGFYLPLVKPIDPTLLRRKKRWRKHEPGCLQRMVKKILSFL